VNHGLVGANPRRFERARAGSRRENSRGWHRETATRSSPKNGNTRLYTATDSWRFSIRA
jgi:hypothetical protein